MNYSMNKLLNLSLLLKELKNLWDRSKAQIPAYRMAYVSHLCPPRLFSFSVSSAYIDFKPLPWLSSATSTMRSTTKKVTLRLTAMATST